MIVVHPLLLSLDSISYFSLSSTAFIFTLVWTSLSFSVRHPVCRVFVEMQLTHPISSLAFSPSSS